VVSKREQASGIIENVAREQANRVIEILKAAAE
jgi:hypothetical protein